MLLLWVWDCILLPTKAAEPPLPKRQWVVVLVDWREDLDMQLGGVGMLLWPVQLV